MKKYLELHQMAIVSFLDQQQLNLMDEPEIETRLPRSFMQLFEEIRKILRDNNILAGEEDTKAD